ncbi:MAG: hypothetical protein ABIH26_15375 [Candidatus Eisenbacteria bacterium]
MELFPPAVDFLVVGTVKDHMRERCFLGACQVTFQSLWWKEGKVISLPARIGSPQVEEKRGFDPPADERGVLKRLAFEATDNFSGARGVRLRFPDEGSIDAEKDACDDEQDQEDPGRKPVAPANPGSLSEV